MEMLRQFSRVGHSEWQRQLIEKFPLIYLEHDDELPYSDMAPCNLRYGFEFDKGWAALVEEFSRVATDLILSLRQNKIQPHAYIHAAIFKEKFGALRWQGRSNLIEPFASLFNGYTRNIERRSLHICEITGERGELRTINDWLTTLCDEEYAKRIQ